MKEIIDYILKHNNWISFADYMQFVLYNPHCGYYTTQSKKFGHEGDFVTAPIISPLFSQCLAHFCMREMPKADILELGAGTGVMAKDILLFLEENQQLPAHYFILEISPDLQIRQKDFLKKEIPHLCDRIKWLDQLPHHFSGILLANEVLDAIPVHLFHYMHNELFEVGVSIENNQLIFKNNTVNADLKKAVDALPIDNKIDYLSEINLNLPDFIKNLSTAMREGLMVFIDYGFDEKTYYHPQRSKGTLMCHYQHQAHTNPLLHPGQEDITAHVDFTALAKSGISAGLEVDYFANQAQFLLENGLIALAKTPDFATAQQINTLTAPHEMGELCKVMVLKK